ncbi:hypothetical protein CI109_105282 [Kwoniella shandongensis]|uniref:SAC domain-containing protein n=1 Tax=Kwoniella shandongensis TaxID=1734106 RepID=A0AAJ8LPC7_9TREE
MSHTSLPPRFTVPPLPPRLHRRLNLGINDEGIVLTPDSGQGVLVRWGVKGKVEPFDGEAGDLIIGGILGVVRLWDVCTLGDIHAIPLVPALANKSHKDLLAVQESRQPKAKTRWSLVLPGRAVGVASKEEDHLSEASSDETPEADESPIPPKTREWTKFMPKLRKSQAAPSEPPQRQELEEKIVRQIIREFDSGFFFSYDFDLTHSLQHKREILAKRTASHVALADLILKENSLFPPSPSGTIPKQPPPLLADDDFIEPDIQVPLWRRVDRRFFWNETLMKDFIDLGLHAYVIPMMQGWVQSTSFRIPIPPNPLDPNVSLGSVPVDLIVVSRRSRERAGLRYQRRGIDDDGHVANMVETEMIVRAKTIINLSEQEGREAEVAGGYRELVNSLERKDVTYTEFDFHAKCHGMKWENISELVDSLDFGSMGYLWTLQGEAIREQRGAYRTK